MNDIQVGDKVRCILMGCVGIEGIVQEVEPHGHDDPVEDHGGITVEVTKTIKNHYLKVGHEEHFVHYEWWKSLEILY